MRMYSIVLLGALALGAAGCTQQQSSSNDFKGAEKSAAQVVLDLSSDASRGRGANVCDELLSARLEKAVAGDSSCISEVKKAFEDADNATLEVEDVTINGSKATVEVSSDDRDETVKRTFDLVREDDSWRIDSFG
jgi:stress response protein SCP2